MSLRSPKPQTGKTTGIRVLIVDDEPGILEILQDQLRGFPIHFEFAANGQEAYHKCVLSETNGPKIEAIICDWIMPKMSGLELLTRLQMNDHFKSIPLMMITAVDERPKVEEAIQRKVNEYIVKPFSAEEVCQKVDRLLKRVSV